MRLDRRTMERPTGEVEASPDEDMQQPRRARRSNLGRWLGGAVVLAVGVIAVVAITGNDGGGEPVSSETVFSFEAVVQTDLVQMDSFDGTLGTEDGDPVGSPVAGTVTSTAEVGTMIEQGDVFLTVGNEPVVLMYGDLPAYRSLTATEDEMSLNGGISGVITDVVAAGETIEQGDVLYHVDGEPVVVFYGDVPAYRTMLDLSENMTGIDVLQLETALVDLGYDPDLAATVDEEFTDYTETMVERWQEDLGVEEDGQVDLGEVIFIPDQAEVLSVAVEVGQTVSPGQPIVAISTGAALAGSDVLQLETALSALGYLSASPNDVWNGDTKAAVLSWQEEVGLETDGVVNLGEVVFLPSPVQVNDVLVSVGSSVSAGTPVLGISSADKFVTFDLPAANQGLVAVGQAVNVEMPDGSDTPGTVLSVASVASGGQGEATFEVRVSLDDPLVAAGLDEAPVDVEIVSDSVSNVVAVPVSALVALAEGGYAVEVDAGNGSTQLVAVEPGFYADGLVEVDSPGLSVGDMVVVP